MVKRLLKYLGFAPASLVRELQYENLQLRMSLENVETQLWKRYENRLKNDLHMSMSWLYTQHVANVYLGQPESQADSTWPYYPKAVMLIDKPIIAPEKL